ncbi:MAG: hypothetical protein WAN93_02690, partial [Solirubrobacteraceae bacterium]
MVKVFGPNGEETPVGGGPSVINGEETPVSEGVKAFNFRSDLFGIAVDNSCYIQKLSGSACTSADPSNGDIYLPENAFNRIDKFRFDGSKYEYVCQFIGFGGVNGSACAKNEPTQEVTPEGTFSGARNVAVDSHGNVYVATIFGGIAIPPNFVFVSPAVYEFNSAGEEVAKISSSLVGHPRGIAVDANGDLYVMGNEQGNVVELKLNASHEIMEETVIVNSGATSVTTDLALGRVFVGFGSLVQAFDSEGRLVGSFGSEVLSGSASVGIGEASNQAYVLNGGQVERFGASLVLADVSTQAASGVTRATATLNGVTNPDGIPTSACQFEYRVEGEASFGHTAPCSSNPGSGEGDVPVSAAVSGLTMNTTYSYRLAVTDTNGANYGQEETFTTNPAVDGVSTGGVEGLTATGVQLTGALSPDGTDAHYYFEYGENESYGSTLPAL